MARRKKSKKSLKTLIIIVLILAIVLGAWYVVSPTSFNDVFGELLVSLGLKEPDSGLGAPEGDLKIHFVDVGQGDAIYVQFPDGKDMLIDAGDRDTDITEGLIAYLDSLGTLVDGLDYLMLTHTDSDHVGGMDNVLEEYVVRRVYMPNVGAREEDPERGYITTSTAYVPFYNAVQNEVGIEVVYNEGFLEIDGSNYSVDIYCPDESYYDGIKPSSSAENKNNMSPVVVIEYAGVRTLLSGDLNLETGSTTYAWSEKHFIEATGLAKLDCDVIKAGHHGSYGSTGEELLNFTDPDYVIVCVGEGNSYEHPHTEFINRVLQYDSSLSDKIYRTDEKGHIVMNIGEDGVYDFAFSNAA